MPQSQRFFCSNCTNPVDEVKIDGRPVPLVVYMVVGQQPDTGPLYVNEPHGVKLPSFIREMMQEHVPTQRLELCIPCLAKLFGLKLYTADADPIYSVEQVRDTRAQLVQANNEDVKTRAVGGGRTFVQQHHDSVKRALLAIEVGRGARKAPKLPKPDPTLRARLAPAPAPAQPAAIDITPPADANGTVTTTAGKARNRARKARAKPQMRHVELPTGTAGGR